MVISLAAVLAGAAFVVAPLPDGELSQLRGGFALPGGLDVAITIQTDTRVDGTLVLSTVYRVDQSTPTLMVNVPREKIAADIQVKHVNLAGDQNGQSVQLHGDRLDVTHLLGRTIGSAIANTGSDRIIDSATTIGIDIRGATPANLGSSMLRVDALANDATSRLIPR